MRVMVGVLIINSSSSSISLLSPLFSFAPLLWDCSGVISAGLSSFVSLSSTAGSHSSFGGSFGAGVVGVGVDMGRSESEDQVRIKIDGFK